MYNNGKNQLHTFDARADGEVFLRYSNISKVFKVFNKRTFVVEELPHVMFDESIDHEIATESITQIEEVTKEVEKLSLDD